MLCITTWSHKISKQQQRCNITFSECTAMCIAEQRTLIDTLFVQCSHQPTSSSLWWGAQPTERICYLSYFSPPTEQKYALWWYILTLFQPFSKSQLSAGRQLYGAVVSFPSFLRHLLHFLNFFPWSSDMMLALLLSSIAVFVVLHINM